jgi:branched-chain amino acid transport system permease protein
MTKKKYRSVVIWIGLFLCLSLLPIVISNQYTIHLLIISGIYTLLAASLNLITGYIGAFSLGHAAFYGIGAYTSALLSVKYHWPFWLTIWPAMFLPAFFGLILAIPCLRLKTSYLVITTLAFGNIVYLLMVNLVWLTRGPLGIIGIPPPTTLSMGSFSLQFVSKTHYFYLVLIFVALVLFFLRRMIDSRTGRAMISLREDDIASEAIGVDVVYYKVLGFVIGSGIAGLAGALYAHYVRFISPESFNIVTSMTVLIMMILGGVGNFYGPIIGAVAITFLLEKMRFLTDYRLMLFGVILFLIIFLMPRGIMGLINDKFILKVKRFGN